MKTVWTIQDAKNCFSEVVEQALHNGPQTITRRGKETAVLVSVDAFRTLAAGKDDLIHFFRKSPLHGADLDIDRACDYGRQVTL